MHGSNKEIIDKQIDDGEYSKIKTLISILRDAETKPVVKKDIIAYLLDSYKILTRADAQAVIDKADEIFFNAATPKNVIVKISILLKKFRDKDRYKDGKPGEAPPSSTDDNIISVDVPDT